MSLQNQSAIKVKVEWTDSDNDLSKQTANIETMLSKGVDAIFFLGFDAAEIRQRLKRVMMPECRSLLWRQKQKRASISS